MQNYEYYCENLIGKAELPMGLAGPLVVSGKTYHVPMATTESRLVASVNRGCKVITQVGGAHVEIKKIGITRAPVLELPAGISAQTAEEKLRSIEAEMKKITTESSDFLELMNCDSRVEGQHLFARFFFDAKDAMGMNMATIAADEISKKCLEPLFRAKLLALSSNFCSDKKACRDHTEIGRGFKVRAIVEIPEDSIRDILKTDSTTLLKVYEAKILEGSQLAGTFAQNAHHANIIAGIFAATGQDLAHTVEGSLGRTWLKLHGARLEFGVEIPALLCGVVGGGTDLPYAQFAFSKVGLADSKIPGEKNAEWAAVIGAAVLAGEISLIASLAEGSLARVHLEARKLKNQHA